MPSTRPAVPESLSCVPWFFLRLSNAAFALSNEPVSEITKLLELGFLKEEKEKTLALLRGLN